MPAGNEVKALSEPVRGPFESRHHAQPSFSSFLASNDLQPCITLDRLGVRHEPTTCLSQVMLVWM